MVDTLCTEVYVVVEGGCIQIVSIVAYCEYNNWYHKHTTAIQPIHHTATQPYITTAILPYSHTAIQPYHY